MEDTLSPEAAASLLQAIAEGQGIEESVSTQTLLALAEMALDLERMEICEQLAFSGRFPLFDSIITDQRTDGLTNQRTDGRTDKASYRVACPQLKRS